MNKFKLTKYGLGIAVVAALFTVLFIVFFKVTFNNNIIQNGNAKAPYAEIKFFSQRTDKKDEIIKLINDFEELHPDIKVNLELIGDPGDYLKRKASVGELPDVTLFSSNIYPSNYNEYFIPIDDLGFSEDNMYNCKGGKGTDGKLYGLVTGLNIPCIIYNKAVFKEAGIKLLPKTDREFFEACEKIKKISKIGMTINYKCNWIMNTWICIIPYLREPDFENKVMEQGKIFTYDGEVVKDLRFVKKILNDDYCEADFMNYEWSQCKLDFVDGKIGMILLSSDFVNQFTAMGMDENDVGIFAFPESKIIMIGSDYFMGISKTTKYPQEAKEFLKYLFDNSRYAEAIEVTSSLKDNKDTKKIIRDLDKYGAKLEFLEDRQDLVIRNDFYNLKVQTNLDWTFVQHFLTCEDEQALMDEINDKWKAGDPNVLIN